MIDIDIYKKNHRYAIRATGHAMYAVHGKDIVCAAVSTLIQAYAFYLRDKQDGIKILEIKLDSGDLNVEYLDHNDIYITNFEMIVAGLDAIKESYHGYLKINKMLENENL